MKRNRAKAVALGLALFGGRLGAAEPDGAPARPVAGSPGLLPAAMRADTWTPAGDPAVWLPAREPATRPAVVVAAPPIVQPAAMPPLQPAALVPAPPTIPPAAEPTGPRDAAPPLLSGPLPVVPAIPEAVAAPPVSAQPLLPTEPRPVPISEPRDARPTAAPVPPPDYVPPRPVQPRPEPLGPPAPLAAPPADELPTAPPALLVPEGWGVPGKHGTFGSAPIQLSRDYPPLADLLHHDGPRGGFRSVEAGGAAVDRLQFQAEYLLWWVSGARYPVLATTSLAPGASPAEPTGNGFLGDPATRVLLGDDTLGGRLRQGLRIRGGWWFDDCGTGGIDGSYFVLGRKTDSYTVASTPGGFPVIARPFYAPNVNPVTGRVIGETGEIVAFPGFAAGVLNVQTASSMWGLDANVRHARCRSCDFEMWWFGGFRFLSLSETLQATESITALADNPTDPAGTRVLVQDRFDTRNRFYGGQLGAAVERNWGRLSLAARGSVALGDTRQTVTISGAQTRLRPGQAPMPFQGGLLAAGPNLGTFSADEFGVVPEVTLNLGYWVTPALKLYAGYNVLYWSSVLRPGRAIDRVVDVTFVPNPPIGVPASGTFRPQVQFQQSSLWVNGIQFGMEWRW